MTLAQDTREALLASYPIEHRPPRRFVYTHHFAGAIASWEKPPGHGTADCHA